MENRSCENCKIDFEINPDEADFHKKIEVLPPKLCPECRMQRRMLFLNDRSLYKTDCKKCGKSVVTAYPSSVPYPIYCQPCWWSDDWDAIDYGIEYDFSKTFFEQFHELWSRVPLPSLNNIHSSNVNSEYGNMTSYLKNCYLLFSSDYDENCSFSSYLEYSKWCYDTDNTGLSEWCYDSIGLFKCYKVFYSHSVKESTDIYFSYDLKGCNNCFGCAGLRNKQYHIFNQPYTKEEYFNEIKKYNLSSYEVVQQMKAKLLEVKLTRPHRNFEGVMNLNVSGDYIFECKNVYDSYQMFGSEDCRYCQFFILGGSKNCLDVTMWGSNLSEAYNCIGVGNGQSKILCSLECWNEATDLSYCKNINSPNTNLFGCMGLRSKQYCILNKQYSPEQYKESVEKIKAKMIEDKVYGEFFPAKYSMYGYNETLANKYFPITKEEALSKGFNWKDAEKKEHKIEGDVVGCAHKGECNQQCSTAFRLTPNEKDYYVQLGIPIPQLCPNCRHYERNNLRNPIKIFSRTCQKCGKIIITSYAPPAETRSDSGRRASMHSALGGEIVYCEQCYNDEIV